MKAKVLIVGGGVMGNSIALHAARRCDADREPVVLLERRDLASGSSGASGAILRQHYAEPTIASMARDSMREYASFEGRTGRSVGFRRTGVLTLAGPERPDSMDRLRRNLERQSKIGIETQLLDAEAIRARVPGIEVSDEAIAAWEPGGGYVDSESCVREFAALARSYGASTRIGVSNTDLIFEEGRVVGAETTEGRYNAEHVVIVAGAWTRTLLAQYGVDLPLKVARVEQHFVSTPRDEEDFDPRLAETTQWHVDLEDPLEEEQARLMGVEQPSESGEHPVILDLEYDFYTRTEPASGRTRVCPLRYSPEMIHDAPVDADSPRPEAGERMREALRRRLPVYRDERDEGSIVSWFPVTPDGRAIIGTVPGMENLVVATGFADHGFKLAPSVGEGVAQLLADEPISGFDPAYFSLERFANGGELNGDWSERLFL